MLTVVLIVLLSFLASAIFQPAKAQQSYRIGMLVSGSVSTHGRRIDAFRQGLRELGYVEGKNIVIEYKYAEGKRERFADRAAEMVRLKPDVIFVGSTGFAAAAKKATSTIPIVAVGGDLVGAGLVASLARPGGNVTGSTNISPDLSGKRLELLKEAVTKVARVAVLWGSSRDDEDEIKQTEIAARRLGVTIDPVPVRAPNEIVEAFAALTQKNANALVIIQGTFTNSHIKQLAELAAKNRLPSIGEPPDYANNGGLMSYGSNNDDLWRRSAIFVDKILKGRTPSDLPVEQPIKFDFVINLKTAKQIALTIPFRVLERADRVIR
ncbi:MAG: ABC transporter substrate-binding protein [Candidatus Binatia bacterium]|jgi:putative ABC transport system substrate-binding protein